MLARVWDCASYGCLVIVVIERFIMAARNGFPVRAGSNLPRITAIKFLAHFTDSFFARALNRHFMGFDDRTLMSLIKELLIATSADSCLICDIEMLVVVDADGFLVRAVEEMIVMTTIGSFLMCAIDMITMIAVGMLLMCAVRKSDVKVTVHR